MLQCSACKVAVLNSTVKMCVFERLVLLLLIHNKTNGLDELNTNLFRHFPSWKDVFMILYSASDQPPTSFYLVRLISKTPCMVLRLGFPIGTPAHVRNKVLVKLNTVPATLPKQWLAFVKRMSKQYRLSSDVSFTPVTHLSILAQRDHDPSLCLSFPRSLSAGGVVGTQFMPLWLRLISFSLIFISWVQPNDVSHLYNYFPILFVRILHYFVCVLVCV